MVDLSNPMARNMRRCFSSVHGPIDPLLRQPWPIVSGIPHNNYGNVDGITMVDNNRANYVGAAQSLPAAGWTIAAIYVAINGTSSSPRVGFCNGVGSGTNDRGFVTGGGINTAYKAYLFDGAQETSGGIGTATAGAQVHLIARCTDAKSLQLCLNGQFDTAKTCANTGYTGYSTPTFSVGNASNSNVASEGFTLVCYWDRALTNAECVSWCSNPWQIFTPQRRLWGFSSGALATGMVPAMTMVMP